MENLNTNRKQAERYYRPELDVVRFLAFLFVFFHHSLPKGDDPRIQHLFGRSAFLFYGAVGSFRFGLTLFFVLSAFLICELLLRERAAVGTIAVKQFYIRRILRIWPLYYLGVTLGMIVALVEGHRSDLAGIGWFAIFMGAWYSSWHGFMRNPIVPLWSISVEEQFYLFAPWTIKYLNRKSLFEFCAVLIAVSIGSSLYLGHTHASGVGAGANSLVQFQCFAAGILLSLVLRGKTPRLALWLRVLLAVGCCICWMVSTLGLDSNFVFSAENPGGWALAGGYCLATLGSVMILVAFMGVDPKLLPRWAIWLGRISFGLYVYHQFAIDLSIYLSDKLSKLFTFPIYALQVLFTLSLTIAMPLAITVAVAALSYRYFETPFLRMKQRHAAIESQPIMSASIRNRKAG